jgi:hypothetical protein
MYVDVDIFAPRMFVGVNNAEGDTRLPMQYLSDAFAKRTLNKISSGSLHKSRVRMESISKRFTGEILSDLSSFDEVLRRRGLLYISKYIVKNENHCESLKAYDMSFLIESQERTDSLEWVDGAAPPGRGGIRTVFD